MKVNTGKVVSKIHQIILLIFSVISIAVVVIVESHLFHFATESLLILTLTLLSLLSIFTLVDVFIDRTKTEVTLQSISKSFNTASGYISNKSNLPSLKDRLNNCHELWISGATLNGLFSDEQRREAIQNFILRKKKLRILLYKRDHELENHILKLWPPDKTLENSKEVYKAEQTLSFKHIFNMLQEIHSKNNALLKNVCVYELSTFLPHSLVIFDPNEKDTCVVQVQIDLMGCNSSNSFPVFQLNTIADEKHKQLFIDEFNFLCSPDQSTIVKYEFK